MAGAVLGIYGNSKEEAVYPIYFVDSAGEPLDASKKSYDLRFPPGALPPVDAFWSLALHVQHASPGAGKESNCLPAPSGPFFMTLRLYLPRKEALTGAWNRPEPQGTPIN